ncbi:MAG: efflux RND transporter permease subunit [Pseudomonadota bacterium]
MMNLSDWGYRNHSAILLTIALMMVFGVISYFTLPAREDPKLTIREAVIVTPYAGMNAQRIDELVTKPLAEAIKSIPEMKEVRATSMEGQSIIHAEVAFQHPNLPQIWDELRNKVEEASVQLPEGADAPIINDEFGDVSVITLALQSDEFDMFELGDLAEHIREQLYTVDGTRKIDILGRPGERVYIEISNAVQAQLGVSLDEVSRQLQSQNVVMPGGAIETESRRLSIAPSGNFETIAQIENVLVRLPDSSTVRLGDYAKVKRSLEDPARQRAYFNSKPGIIFAISMEASYSVLNYSERASAEIERVRASLPAGVTLSTVTYQAKAVENSVYGVSINVVQTLFIVLAVVILFLGMRTGLIVGSIVPVVVLITLAVMGFAEIRIQRMSLATIVIALGLLVDNGIVIAEDFKSRLAEGVDRRDAIGETGRELALPLLSSTITTILVFLPLMLAADGSGEYTRSIALVILISLTASWLIAMLVTPTLCYWFAKAEDEKKDNWRKRNVDKVFRRSRRRYETVLRGILGRKKLFMGGVIIAFLAAGFGMGLVPQQFFPASDRPEVLVYADMPVGTSSAKTNKTIAAISRHLEDKDKYPGIKTIAAYSGFGGPRFVLSLAPVDPAPNRGFMVIRTDDRETRDEYVKLFRRDLAEAFPEARLRISSMFLGPSDTQILQLQVRGPDDDVLIETGERLAAVFRSVGGTIDVFSDWKNPTTQLTLNVDQAAARAAGVTSADVSSSLAMFFSGRSVGIYRDGDDQVPIVLRAPDRERLDPGRLESVVVFPSNGGASVQLGEIATLSLEPKPGRIQSEDLIKTLTIEGRPLSVTPEDLIGQIQPQIDEIEASLPPGHFLEYDGIIEQTAEGNKELFSNFPLMLAMIVILLVLQFKGFKRAGIVFAILPLSIIGAALGLLLLQASFGFMVILGLFALFGILINNAIVLIDRIDIERAAIADESAKDYGEAAFEAIISACLRRFRPIIMTMITTIVGLLPLIIGGDVLFYGMASAIAGGLIVGTVLTLGVVPVLYAVLFAEPEQSGQNNNHGDSDGMSNRLSRLWSAITDRMKWNKKSPNPAG